MPTAAVPGQPEPAAGVGRLPAPLPHAVPRPPGAAAAAAARAHLGRRGRAQRPARLVGPARVEQRTPPAGAELVRTSWIDVGLPRRRPVARVARARPAPGRGLPRRRRPRPHQPLGIERTVSLRTEAFTLQGRVDRLDDRGDDGWPSSTTRPAAWEPADDDARTSLPLALYAAAVWKMFRRRCVRVELHHLPSGTVAAHEHTGESLQRKIDEAESIARDARRAEDDYAEHGVDSGRFPAQGGPAVPVVRLPGALPGRSGRGPGEVRLGRPGAAAARLSGRRIRCRLGRQAPAGDRRRGPAVTRTSACRPCPGRRGAPRAVARAAREVDRRGRLVAVEAGVGHELGRDLGRGGSAPT